MSVLLHCHCAKIHIIIISLKLFDGLCFSFCRKMFSICLFGPIFRYHLLKWGGGIGAFVDLFAEFGGRHAVNCLKITDKRCRTFNATSF